MSIVQRHTQNFR